jgi:hypothetical protein
MRRLIVMGTVTLLALASLAAVVRADAPKTPAARDASPPMEQLAVPEFEPAAAVPPFTCNPNDPVQRYLNCLNKYLNRLAKNLNSTIADLRQTQNDLYNLYACFFAVPVTQYGENPYGGSHGYVYGFSDGSAFLTTALDYTMDPATEWFDYFLLVDPACVSTS